MKKILYSLFVLSSLANISNAAEEFFNAERKAKHTHYWQTMRVNPETFTIPMHGITPSFRIGVADTGFNVSHPMIRPNVGRGINGRDGNTYVAPSVVCDPTRPDYGKVTTHGTDVAGICALMNPVVIVPGKLGACGNRPDHALEEVLNSFALVKEICIVNISGFTWDYSFKSIFNLARAGKTVVIAGGNYNEILHDRIQSNGRMLSQNLQDLNGRVLFVGATEKENNGIERRACYSSWPCPTLAPYFISAPGTVDTINYRRNSQGTSYAAPVFVSAMARLSLEFSITVDAARDILFSTAIKKSNDQFNVENTGVGIVNFMAAWNELKRSKEIEILNRKQEALDTYRYFAAMRQDAEGRAYQIEQQIRGVDEYINQLASFSVDAKISQLQMKAFENGKAAVQDKLRSLNKDEFGDKDLAQQLKDIWVSHEREAAQELREFIEACRQTNNSLLLATLDKVELWKSACNLRLGASHYSNQELTASLKLDDQSHLSKCKDASTASRYHFQMSQSARNWERYEYGQACALHRYADYLNSMLQDGAFIDSCVSLKNEQQRDQIISEMIFKARFSDLINEKAPKPNGHGISQYGA